MARRVAVRYCGSDIRMASLFQGRLGVPELRLPGRGIRHRICDSLRAGGIDVWLDQSELRGGDAWDHKTIGQIHSCRLFIPVYLSERQQPRSAKRNCAANSKLLTSASPIGRMALAASGEMSLSTPERTLWRYGRLTGTEYRYESVSSA
jgi:hypothetical protein